MTLAVLEESILKGTSICRGVAIGKPFFLGAIDDNVPHFSIPLTEVEEEVKRFRHALKKTREDIVRLQAQLRLESVHEGAAILEAHLLIMRDPSLSTEVEEKIRITCINAEWVFFEMIKDCKNKFAALDNPYFQERSKDVEDIAWRIMGYLSEKKQINFADVPSDSIVIANELTPSIVAGADSKKIAAFITEAGGATAHAAIIARAKGIPYVSSIAFDNFRDLKNEWVIVDGRTGHVILNPEPETHEKYIRLQRKLVAQVDALDKIGSLASETYDGFQIGLCANIDMDNELDMLHQYGGKGVGLYRSESVFHMFNRFPDEDEQYKIYCNVVQKMKGLPIVIRTFDVGGDKCTLEQLQSREVNPFLGCRAIRFLLKERPFFKTQIRAILRAALFGRVSIMFPMIAGVNELKEAQGVIEEVKADLDREQIEYSKNVRIGCMIEVPSAAIVSDLLAAECDFLSIGTNDLVQYSLAVDRTNHEMSRFYTPTHPSIIRLIRLIVEAANRNGIPVTVCGEVAADPRFTPLLLGLGVHELSVASLYLPVIKNAIRNTSIVRASHLAEETLKLSTAHEILDLLEREYQNTMPEDCFYNY